jgi:hypothetical protein|eukprot:Tamp_28232.p2 GENE.Tamp_28232~~Tamp_28232.p2  ORF type:complete len:100 (+),score=6.86 Tamp_28232:172-471(+)
MDFGRRRARGLLRQRGQQTNADDSLVVPSELVDHLPCPPAYLFYKRRNTQYLGATRNLVLLQEEEAAAVVGETEPFGRKKRYPDLMRCSATRTCRGACM